MKKKKKSQALTIDQQTAERITLAVLKDYRAYLKKELRDWKANPQSEENPDGVWMHPEDVGNNTRRIAAITLLVADFE